MMLHRQSITESSWCMADGAGGTFLVRHQPSNGIPGTLMANRKTMQQERLAYLTVYISRLTEIVNFVLENKLGTLFCGYVQRRSTRLSLR